MTQINLMLDKETLENLRKDLRFHDRGIFEKAVYVFRLLDGLLKVYPELVFKGGTSILLHIFPPLRFSIDVDIILNPEEEKSLENSLKKVSIFVSDVFAELQEDVRKDEKGIPKRHFKFYYNSHYSRIKQYILLDIVFCKSPYSRLTRKKLSNCPLSLEPSMSVNTPSIDGLFADKLAAISPKTVGIILDAKREMEFVKQVIDLGTLFGYLENTNDIFHTFKSSIEVENDFRMACYSETEVIKDILDVAFKYCQYLLRGANNSFKEIGYINSGLKRVGNHLLSKYTPSDLKISFSKIAYVCKLLSEQKASQIIKTVDYDLIEGRRLGGQYRTLQGLKKTNPQSYFYWALAFGEKEI